MLSAKREGKNKQDESVQIQIIRKRWHGIEVLRLLSSLGLLSLGKALVLANSHCLLVCG